MRTGGIISLVIFLISIILSCAEKNVAVIENTVDTTSVTTDQIEIKYSNSGGMSPISEYIFISNDSASWKYGRYNEEVLLSWVPAETDIKEIVTTLEINNFKNIESTKKEEVYDRGGVKIQVNVNGAAHVLDNSGLIFIKEEWHDEFRAIREHISNYVKSEVDKQMLHLNFKVKASAYESKEPIRVWINNQLFYDSKEVQAQPIEKIVVYPGTNTYDWTIYFADSTGISGRPVYKAGGESSFNADGQSQEIVLDKSNGEIKMISN